MFLLDFPGPARIAVIVNGRLLLPATRLAYAPGLGWCKTAIGVVRAKWSVPMAKKQSFDRQAVSPKTSARPKGRQSPQNLGMKHFDTSPAATQIGDPADSASEPRALPATIAVLSDTADRPEKPRGADGVNEATMRSFSDSAEPEKPSRETTVQAGGTDTKRAQLIMLLERPDGASIEEIGERLGWLPHTVRAALTGLRHAGRELKRDKNAEGRSVYRLCSGASTP
jgi:hypothetical protein